ncbi:MAG: TPM domain-containing protein [Pseudomonadota bacterium]
MTLLTESEADQVTELIHKVERDTDAELVVVLARQADDYFYIPTLWAALIALVSPGLVMLLPYWLDVSDVLLIQLVVFIVIALLLRIPLLMHWLIPSSVKRWRAENLARRMFLENNLHHTVDETGVLIFVSEAEHYVEIIADRGINNCVQAHEWKAIVDDLTNAIRQGRRLEGFCGVVQSCGVLLKTHVPKTQEKNELPNHLIILD